MRPLRIILEDFMSHKFTDIDCTQFNSVLVVGRNRNDSRKSMGVGKSNIFKAIEYAIFGESQIKLDKIIRYNCERCRVTFEFEISNEIYKIVRSRVRKSAKSDLRMFHKVNNDWIDITQKTSTETEQELLKIIKISHIAFRSSILFAQADLHGLASVTPRERKAMLKEPLQISAYNKYEKLAKEKTTSILKEVEKIKILIEGLGHPSVDLVKLLSYKTEMQTALTKNDTQQIELSSKLEATRNVFADLQKSNLINIDDLYRQRTEIQQNKKNLHEKIKVISNSLNNKEIKSEFLTKEIDKAKNVLVKFEENCQNIINCTVRAKVDIKNDISKMISKEIDGNTYILRLRSEKVKFSVVTFDGDVCNHCHQLINQEHRQICEEKRKKDLVEVIANLEKYGTILTTVINKRAQYEKELEEFDIRENLLNSTNNKISVKKNEIIQNDANLKQLAEMIEFQKSELKRCIDDEAILIPQEKLICNQIEEYKKIIKIEEIKKELLLLETEVQSLLQKKSAIHVNLGMIEEKISTKEKDKNTLLRLHDDLEIKEKELSMRLKVQQAFSSSGIPTMIINTILDDLQIVVNELLTDIRPGIEISFLVAKTKTDGQQEDTLDIVYRVDGIEHEYDQISGGQKVIVALCFKLALSLIIQHRIGVDIKFLMLDEVDSQFDENTLEAFVDVIKKWQSKFTIFVITHNKDLKDKFTHAILVEGDEINGAIGTLVNSW